MILSLLSTVEQLGCGLEVCQNPHIDEVDQQEGGDPAAVQLAVDSTQALVQTGKSSHTFKDLLTKQNTTYHLKGHNIL